MQRLRQIRDEGAEGAELEVCRLALSLASRALSQYQLTVLQRSQRVWRRNFPLVNYVQNRVFGTFYTPSQRLEEIDFASKRVLGLLGDMEAVLLDITRCGNDTPKQVVRTTAELLSSAFGGAAFPVDGNREFIDAVLESLSQECPWSALDVRAHEPLWGKRPVQLPSLRQVVTCAVVGASLAAREQLVESLYSFASFLQRNVWEPTQAMWIDLFSRPPVVLLGGKSELSVLEDAQQSLQRMLDGMHFTSPSQVSLAFEKEMPRPIYNAIFGDLVSLALVQVQVVKIESLKLAMDLERLLRDNQFNSKLLVVLPSLWVAVQVVTYSYRLARYMLFTDEGFVLSQRASVADRVQFVMWEIETLLIQEEDGNWEAEPTSKRALLVGQLVVEVHELVHVLRQARGTLFAGDRGEHKFAKAVGDAQYLLPRAGWSAPARLSLVRALQRQVV